MYMLFPKKPLARLLTHANSEALDLLAQTLGARPGMKCRCAAGAAI